MGESFDFSVEAQQIGEQIKDLLASSSGGGKFTSELKSLQQKISDVINELDQATSTLEKSMSAKAKLKRVKKQIDYQDNDGFLQSFTSEEEREKFIQAFNQYKSEHSKQIRRTESNVRANFEAAKNDIIDEANIKQHLLRAYHIIMEIRAAIKGSHIKYGVFFAGEVNGREEVFMWTPSVDDLVQEGFLGSSLDIQLLKTGAEIQSLLNENIMNNSIGNQFQNFLQSEEDRINWKSLLAVREKILSIKRENKKIYYNFGQLIEALVYLRGKELTTNNIYDALVQGANAIPFEVSGDFTLGSEEVQAKMFAAYGGSETSVHRIRIMKLSGIKRVLKNISNALQSSADPQSLRSELDKVFSHQGYNTMGEKTKQILRQIVDNELSDILPNKN